MRCSTRLPALHVLPQVSLGLDHLLRYVRRQTSIEQRAVKKKKKLKIRPGKGTGIKTLFDADGHSLDPLEALQSGLEVWCFLPWPVAVHRVRCMSTAVPAHASVHMQCHSQNKSRRDPVGACSECDIPHMSPAVIVLIGALI